MKYRYSCRRREAGTSVADIEIQIEMVASTSLSTLGAGAGAGAVAFVKLSPGNSYSSCSRAAPQLLCGSFGISLKASSSFSLSTSCSVQVRKVLVKSSISSVAADADDFDIPQWHREIFEEFDRLVPTLPEKTWYPKGADAANSKKQWYIVDATDKILGRLASTIAIHIRGKHLPTFTPSMDMGSYVIVVNAEKVAVSGKKRSQKLYRRHSGRPGGMKEETFEQLQKRIPERIVEHAVKGMLPKGRLGRRLFTHLKVYKGPDHPHEAQQPKPLPLPKKRITLEK